MLLSVESGPENRIFENFCPHDFRKIAQRNFKVRVAYFPEKWIILTKNIFSSKSARNHDCMSLIRKSF